MANAESKCTIPGTVTIDEGVVQDMVGYAAMTCYGVAGMAAPNLSDSLAKCLPSHKLRRGILIKNEEDSTISVELYVVVKYGTNLSVVAENLADTVRYYVTEFLHINVKDISVIIQGVKK